MKGDGEPWCGHVLLSSSWSKHVTLDPSGPAPAPYLGLVMEGRGPSWLQLEPYPLPAQQAQNTAPPSCDPPTLLPPQPHSHPLCQGEPGPGCLESQPPPPGWERKEEERNESRQMLAPTHIYSSHRKCYPKCLSTTHPGAHTPAGTHTHTLSTDAFREPRHLQILADTQARYMTSLTHTQLTYPDTETLK